MLGLAKKIEFAANVSIIVVAILLAVVLIRQNLMVRTVYPENSQIKMAMSDPKSRFPVLIGMRISKLFY